MPEITQLIPQRAPILEVDRLVSCSENQADTELVVRQDNFFTQHNKLQEPGLIEHMAQSAAAFAGCATFLRGEKPHLGYIGEVKKCHIAALPTVGQILRTTVTLISEIGDVSLVTIKTMLDDKQIAECQMKIALQNE